MNGDDERDYEEEAYWRAFCDPCGTSPCGWDGRPDGSHTNDIAPTPEDTTGCTVDPACETCGASGRNPDDLAVALADTPLGLVCLTLCADCEQAGRTPSLSCPAAARHVLQHAEHTGLTVDDLTERRSAS